MWDLTNGDKLLRIKEAHGEREITCLTMDSRCRRVLTGSSDGEVKVSREDARSGVVCAFVHAGVNAKH